LIFFINQSLTLTKIGYVKIWWRIGGEAGWETELFAMGFASWLHPLRPLGPLFGTYGKTWTCFFNDVYHLVMADIAMEISTIFKNGKPSISMGHLYHGYVK